MLQVAALAAAFWLPLLALLALYFFRKLQLQERLRAIERGADLTVAGGTPTRPSAPRLWPGLVGLGGLIAALLAVGEVSGTLTRHVIQVAPAALALTLVASGSPYGRAAALPILTLWAGLMG